MVGIKIIGVHQRDEMIAAMNEELKLPDSDIIYDERPEGGVVFPVAKQAWLAPYAEGETHRVVLNDDSVRFASRSRQPIQTASRHSSPPITTAAIAMRRLPLCRLHMSHTIAVFSARRS